MPARALTIVLATLLLLALPTHEGYSSGIHNQASNGCSCHYSGSAPTINHNFPTTYNGDKPTASKSLPTEASQEAVADSTSSWTRARSPPQVSASWP